MNDVVLMWLFPTECFQSFKEVYVLTYLFGGQQQKAYYDIHGLSYEMWSVTKAEEGYTLVPHNPELDRPVIEKARKLITIYEGPRNRIGDRTGRSYPLSNNWFQNYRSAAAKLMETTRSWFLQTCEVKADQALWTTFKRIKEGPRGLSPKSFKGAWLPLNTRATNEYRYRTAVAYLANVFFRVPVSRYFEVVGVTLDENLYATSELIQFVWRSAIREGQPIQLFVPSERMRWLLKMWLDCSIGDLAEPVLVRALEDQAA